MTTSPTLASATNAGIASSGAASRCRALAAGRCPFAQASCSASSDECRPAMTMSISSPSKSGERPPKRWPAQGEHTDEILREDLGLTDAEIAGLPDSAIAGHRSA